VSGHRTTSGETRDAVSTAAAASTTEHPGDPGARAGQSAAPSLLLESFADEAIIVKVQTFRWTSLALGWYESMIWAWIYAADPARTWLGTSVRLFNVLSHKNEVSLRNPRGAVDAVGDTIARRIGNLSLPGSSQTMREI
jgi:hypothetical protein